MHPSPPGKSPAKLSEHLPAADGTCKFLQNTKVQPCVLEARLRRALKPLLQQVPAIDSMQLKTCNFCVEGRLALLSSSELLTLEPEPEDVQHRQRKTANYGSASRIGSGPNEAPG